MNILIVTQYFYPEQFRINDIARALVEKGHKVLETVKYEQHRKPYDYRRYYHADIHGCR